MSLKCKKCGNEISDDDSFCKFCGAVVNNIENEKKSVSALVTLMLLVVIVTFIIFFIFDYIENDEGYDSAVSQESKIFDSDDEDEYNLPQGPFSYSIGGITFSIPDDYYFEDGIFVSDYSKLVFTNEAVEDFWSVYLLVDNAAFNDIADQQIGEVLTDPYREISQSTYVEGNKTLLYVYSGEHDGQPVRVLLAMILNSNTESCIYTIYETESDSDKGIDDFEEILNAAEVTGAADSTDDPRSIFYIDKEKTDE